MQNCFHLTGFNNVANQKLRHNVPYGIWMLWTVEPNARITYKNIWKIWDEYFIDEIDIRESDTLR